jgi:hypothetical protein
MAASPAQEQYHHRFTSFPSDSSCSSTERSARSLMCSVTQLSVESLVRSKELHLVESSNFVSNDETQCEVEDDTYDYDDDDASVLSSDSSVASLEVCGSI